MINRKVLGVGVLDAERPARTDAAEPTFADATISLVAGRGVAGYLGHGGPATLAQLNGPTGVAVDGASGILVVDASNRVRRIAFGTITTVAGFAAAADSAAWTPTASSRRSPAAAHSHRPTDCPPRQSSSWAALLAWRSTQPGISFCARSTAIASGDRPRKARPHECQEAVVLNAARRAHDQMDAEAREPCLGVLPAELGLDVAFEDGAGGPATRVAIVDREDRLEEGAVDR